MKGGTAVRLREILTYITLGWSASMAALYGAVVFRVPVFALISYLPLGEYICRIFEYILLFGIWAVPVLWLVTVIFVLMTRKRAAEDKRSEAVGIAAVVLPVVLAAFMAATSFLEILS